MLWFLAWFLHGAATSRTAQRRQALADLNDGERAAGGDDRRERGPAPAAARPGAGGRGASTSGGGWRGRSTTRWRRGSPGSSPSCRRPSRQPSGPRPIRRAGGGTCGRDPAGAGSLTEARRSVDALRPEPLESCRLSEALADVAERWSALNGIPVQVTTTGTARPIRPEAEFALLRAAQEALANVARHAHADAGRADHFLYGERGRARRARRRRRASIRRPLPARSAASAWSRCGSGSRACPARCRSNPSRAAAPRSRPACRPCRVLAARERPPPASRSGC